jgi:hypothetical protein
MSVQERLQQLGLRLPEIAPTAEFLRVNLIDDLAFVSGHAPFADGEFCFGTKSDGNSTCRRTIARQNGPHSVCLASLEDSIGSLDAVRRIVKLNGYVNWEPEFDDLPRVTDAASKLLVDLFGDSGRHARTTLSRNLSANSFPFGPIYARATHRRPRVARARLRASDSAIPALIRMWFL